MPLNPLLTPRTSVTVPKILKLASVPIADCNFLQWLRVKWLQLPQYKKNTIMLKVARHSERTLLQVQSSFCYRKGNVVFNG